MHNGFEKMSLDLNAKITEQLKRSDAKLSSNIDELKALFMQQRTKRPGTDLDGPTPMEK